MTKAMLWGLLLLAVASHAQFTCTIEGSTDESSCLKSMGDDGNHCVWCSLASFEFCLEEDQAEAMEQNLPLVACDRYSQNDDDASDDAVTDDAVETDDNVVPTDDAIPDDYWTCLRKKDTAECTAAGCTWCDTKAGFGLCMTGPSADAAADSDWFTCTSTEVTALGDDPYDPSCVLAFMETQSEEGCKSSVDEDGNPCEWCDLQGMAQLCLTEEQAEMASQLGVTCDASSKLEALKDPYDTDCMMAYMVDPTQQGCEAATDEDGNACEWVRSLHAGVVDHLSHPFGSAPWEDRLTFVSTRNKRKLPVSSAFVARTRLPSRRIPTIPRASWPTSPEVTPSRVPKPSIRMDNRASTAALRVSPMSA